MADLYQKMRAFQKTSRNPVPARPSKEQKPTEPLPEHLSTLSQIPGVTLARELVRKVEIRERERDSFLESLGGHERELKSSRYWLRRSTRFLHQLPYKEEELDGYSLRQLARDESFADFDPRKAAFIDTETTGLAGGTGTYAFLVGIGRFVDDGFTVNQYFMRDYDEEPAMLDAILDDLRSARYLVSFNGKCFDIPLLATRLRMNRRPAVVESLSHFDLLHPARRLWRQRCESCTLTNLEAVLLGHERDIDVPAFQIPQIYFDFTRGIGIRRIQPVLEHNVDDIVSLAMLSAKACRMYRLPELEASNAIDWYSLGRAFIVDGDKERARMCLERSLQIDLPLGLRWTAQRDYSLLLKRNKEYSVAVEVWREMLNGGTDRHPFPYEELAKYYEHIERRPLDALRLVQDFLASLDSPRLPDRESPSFSIDRVRNQFGFRLKRLMRKADTCNRGT